MLKTVLALYESPISIKFSLLGMNFAFFWHQMWPLLVLFRRVSRKAKAAAVAEEKDQKAEDEKEIDNGLVLLLRSIFQH